MKKTKNLRENITELLEIKYPLKIKMHLNVKQRHLGDSVS